MMDLGGKFGVKHSMRNKIFILLILASLLSSLIIGISSYFISIVILRNKVSSSFNETVAYVGENVDRELSQIQQVSNYIFADTPVKNLLVNKNQSQYETMQLSEEVERSFQNVFIMDLLDQIDFIGIFDNKELKYIYGNDCNPSAESLSGITDSQYFQTALQNNGRIYFAGVKTNLISSKYTGGQDTLSVLRVIKDANYLNNIGVMLISVNTDMLSSQIPSTNMTVGSRILIVDNNNEIINSSHPDTDSQFLKRVLAADQSSKASVNFEDKSSRQLVFCRNIQDYGWKVIGIIPEKQLVADNRYIVYVMLLAFLFSLIISSIIWYFIASQISNPVRSLLNAMNEVKDGNLSAKAEILSNDEIGSLAFNFNYMVQRINQLFGEVIEQNAKRKDAEYRALQAQINPHFLYNTLNSIRWMAIIQKADNIKNVVDVLARLLKNSTGTMEQFITLESEINNLKDYLFIQKLAYTCKFEVFWDIEDEVLSRKCLKFILQPLVENAIFHGIGPKEGMGSITISAYSIRYDCLPVTEISVTDNGAGMTQEQIDNIFAEDRHPANGRGIGLKNVNRRMMMTYGDAYRIQIESEKDRYTRIFLRVPYDDKKDAYEIDESHDRR